MTATLSDLLTLDPALDAGRPFPGAVHRSELTPEIVARLSPPQIYAKVLAASCNAQGNRIYTLEVGMPRLVLSEFNTHHAIYRNSGSTRAVPLAKQIERVETEPYLPFVMPINKSGMAAEWYALPGSEPYEAMQARVREGIARDIELARDLSTMAHPLHKQNAGRYLEPHLFHKVITTGTEWEGFMRLRIAADAQPEIQAVAVAMRDAMSEATPTLLAPGEWHLPLVGLHPDDAQLSLHEQIAVSTGRCARASYLTHDGRRDVEADITLGRTLWAPGHASPFEHQATPIPPDGRLRRALARRLGVDTQRRYALRGFANTRYVLDHRLNSDLSALLGATT